MEKLPTSKRKKRAEHAYIYVHPILIFDTFVAVIVSEDTEDLFNHAHFLIADGMCFDHPIEGSLRCRLHGHSES